LVSAILFRGEAQDQDAESFRTYALNKHRRTSEGWCLFRLSVNHHSAYSRSRNEIGTSLRWCDGVLFCKATG
jgi:hypothetical protein